MTYAGLCRFVLALAAIVGVVPQALVSAANAAAPVVNVEQGALVGTMVDGVERFAGVPFAAPPIGALRWQPPAPALSWSGTRSAKAFGAACMQWLPDWITKQDPTLRTSEDCLTINVWRPAGASAKKLPVMVWIHGGAWTMGAGSLPVTDGTHLAKQGVVVVTLNYRLGRFGFFSHPALTAESKSGLVANYGLMDQIAALKWVRRNIEAFGGDARNVTIFGESAGAYCVNALMTSPEAQGLFAKAIAESGGGQKGHGVIPDTTLQASEAQGLAWTRGLKLADDDVKGLRALPASTIMGPADPRVGVWIIIDGKIVPRPVDRAFLSGAFAHVPYMVGANSWEESLEQGDIAIPDTALDDMGRQKSKMLAIYTDDGRIARDTAVRHLWGDTMMAAPARFLATRVAAANVPAYLYRFSYVPPSKRGEAAGAAHGSEVAYVFDNADSSSEKPAPADADMAKLMSAYWVRFAKTGDPNGAGAPRWRRYDPQSDWLLDFSTIGAFAREHFEQEKFNRIDCAYHDTIGVADAYCVE